MDQAAGYHEQIWNIFHSLTYAYYGNDSEDYRARGTITWRVERWRALPGRDDIPPNEALPERYVHDSVGQPLRCVIQPPSAAGDGTVPAEEGAAGVRRASPAVLRRTTGYEHQGSYNNDAVRAFVLDSVVRAIVPLKVPA